MIPRFTWSCKNPWNSTCTKWNLVIKIFKEVKLLKPLTYIICSMGRIEHINTYFFMMKCEIKIFSLEFMPSLGNGAAICPLQKSMKSKYWLHEDLGTTYLLYCFDYSLKSWNMYIFFSLRAESSTSNWFFKNKFPITDFPNLLLPNPNALIWEISFGKLGWFCL